MCVCVGLYFHLHFTLFLLLDVLFLAPDTFKWLYIIFCSPANADKMDIVFVSCSSQFALRSYLYILFHKLVGWPASVWFGWREEEKVKLHLYINYLNLFHVVDYNYISNKMFRQ